MTQLHKTRLRVCTCMHAPGGEEGPGASQQRHERQPPTGLAAAGAAPSFLPGPSVQAVEVTRESSFLVLKSGPPGKNFPSPAAPRAADTHGSSRQQGLWPHLCTHSLTPLGSSGQAWECMSEVLLVRVGKVLGQPAAEHGRPHQGQERMGPDAHS